MNLRYLKNRRAILDFKQPEPWDIFVSAYNDSRRVQQVFQQCSANQKHWVVLPEYDYQVDKYPNHENVHAINASNEADLISELIGAVGIEKGKNQRLCVDITGFMRPQILHLVFYLETIGIKTFDMLYTEPEQYGRKEDTKFSDEVESVRQVYGFDGPHSDDLTNDILIVGVGYDHGLVSRVVGDKEGAKLIQLMSLPSLSADMYQESILRMDRASLPVDSVSEDRVFFAPANDPFVVASELSIKLQQLRSRQTVGNLYLSPLATKPQALGFALFFMAELKNQPASILFPFSRRYSKETSTGVGRSWIYEIRL